MVPFHGGKKQLLSWAKMRTQRRSSEDSRNEYIRAEIERDAGAAEVTMANSIRGQNLIGTIIP